LLIKLLLLAFSGGPTQFSSFFPNTIAKKLIYNVIFATLFEIHVKELRNFNIDIYKLKNGIHHYEFDVDQEFFDFFNFDLINSGKGKAILILDKTETFIDVTFKFEGTIGLVCDRSLETFDYEVNNEHKIMFKYGDHDEEISDEIMVIDRNTQRLNVAQYIYEFIVLAVPMKKLHPRFVEEMEEDEEIAEADTILIYSSAEKEEEKEEPGEEDIDPRWKLLKQFKENNNNN